MRFTTAWAEVVSQNLTFKIVAGLLSLVAITLAVALVQASSREPLIIDRACVSRTVVSGNTERTAVEIQAFVEEALKARFNTEAEGKEGLLSPQELAFRKQEQENLKASQMTQKVIVNKVSVKKDSVNVDADRLVSVGAIRSAFIFPLSVTLTSVLRSELNPYGLLLSKVSQTKETGK
jgi:hypothetical protein